MQVQVRWGEVAKSDALDTHISEQIEHAMRYVGEHFTRVDVHVHDDNADKSGPNDKRVVIEARPAGADPLSVDGTGDDLYKTVTAVAKKLERVTRTFVDRHRKR